MRSVQGALTKVSGVTKADVSLEKEEAVVTFDDRKTNAEALIKAVKQAGYPSRIKGPPK